MTGERVDVVRTAAGWHGRVVAGNGEIVWTTEVLSSPGNVGVAIGVLAGIAAETEWNYLDERYPTSGQSDVDIEPVVP